MCARPDSWLSMRDAVGFGFGLAEDRAVDVHRGVRGEHGQVGVLPRATTASAFSRARRIT